MKIKVTADTVLKIMKGIMEDDEVNYTITDTSAPQEWQNKTVQEVLSVDYYTFKHRPVDTEQVVRGLIEQGQSPSSLLALTRSFCLVSLNSVERVFSKANDIINVSVNFEYWLNTDKIKLLEDMLEDISVGTTGERILLQVGTERRRVLVALGNLGISEIEHGTEFGEMAICEFNAEMIFYPDVVSMADYKVEISTDSTWVELPVSSIALSNSMTQKTTPYVNNPRNVGSINLSRVKSIVLTFDGYNNSFVNYLSGQSLAGDSTLIDNNEALLIRLTRNGTAYTYNCVIKEHILTVQEDTGNEVHSLTVTTRGIIDGTT